jgi:hypothetical protein
MSVHCINNGCQSRLHVLAVPKIIQTATPPLGSRPVHPVRGLRRVLPARARGFPGASLRVSAPPRPIRAAHPSAGRRGPPVKPVNPPLPGPRAPGPGEKEAGSLASPLPHVAGSLETRWLATHQAGGPPSSGRKYSRRAPRTHEAAKDAAPRRPMPPTRRSRMPLRSASAFRGHRRQGRRVASWAPARACGTGAPVPGAWGPRAAGAYEWGRGCPRSSGQRAGSGPSWGWAAGGARAGQLVRALRVLTASCSAWGSWALGSPAGTESSAPALDGAAAGCTLGPWGTSFFLCAARSYPRLPSTLNSSVLFGFATRQLDPD